MDIRALVLNLLLNLLLGHPQDLNTLVRHTCTDMSVCMVTRSPTHLAEAGMALSINKPQNTQPH